MPSMTLDVVDAAELAELLQFLSGWTASDPARLAPSLLAFVGHPAYGLPQLRNDLDASPSSSAAVTARTSSASTDTPAASPAVTTAPGHGLPPPA